MKVREIIEIPLDKSMIQVSPSNILDLLGYGDKAADDHICDLVNTCLNKSISVFKPKGGIVFLENEGVNIPSGQVFCGDKSFNTGKIIASQLKYAEYIALFACTISNEVEILSKKMMDCGDLLEGVIFDLIGSEAAEETAAILHQSISAIASVDSFKVTNRFSPGYCNWSVQEQHQLFSFFEKPAFGITLNSSALMNPIKSVSGILGVGKKVKFHPYSCSICSDENCIYRNRKSHALT
jgi:hypothetical protein